MTVIHGDCVEEMKKLPDNYIDLTVTSPPYFNAKDYSQYESLDDYMSTMESVFEEVYRILKESRMCIINIAPVIVSREKRSEQSYRIPLPFYFVPMMEDLGFEFLEDIIWEKPEGAVPNRNGGFNQHRKPISYKPNVVTEYILVFKKKADFLIDKVLEDRSLVVGDYERTNIWKISPKTNSGHPAPFPDELAEKCIKYYSYESNIVLDPFAGSGTTLLMARKLNRRYIGIEINSDYVASMKQALKQEVFYQ